MQKYIYWFFSLLFLLVLSPVSSQQKRIVLTDSGSIINIDSLNNIYQTAHPGPQLPAPNACASTNNLATPMNQNNSQRGIMFDVTAISCVTIRCFEGNFDTGTTGVQIWYRPGTHVGFANSSIGWTLLGTATGVVGLGINLFTPIPLPVNVTINAGATAAFYITRTTVAGPTIRYTDGTALGAVFSSDANIQVKDGTGKEFSFSTSFSPRRFNGKIFYDVGSTIVNVGSVIGASPACSGTQQTFSVASVAGATTYNWTVPVGSSIIGGLGTNSITVNMGTNSGNVCVSPVVPCGIVTPSCFSVTVISNQTITPTASPTSVCVGNSTQLNVLSGATFSWSPAVSLSCTNCANPIATPITNTTYTVTTNTSGCIGTGTTTVNVLQNPTALATNSGPFCEGNTINLSATGGTTYSWSGPGGFNSLSQNPTIASSTASMSGTYTVTATVGSCTAITTTSLTVNASPNVTVNSEAICNGQAAATLTANGATNYTWSPTINLSSATGSVVSANPNSSTTYTVFGSNGNCTSTASSTVTVLPNPIISVNSGSICSGSSLTLTANGATNYTWSPTTNLSSSTGSVVVANPNTTTVYSVIGANGSCTAIATSTVDVIITPTLSVNSGSICSGSSLTLTANGATNYAWSPTTNLSSSTGSVVVANPSSTTIYSVLGANGTCTATATSTVGVNSNPIITVNSSSICVGQQTATLAANGASTYSWIPTTNLSAATGSLVTGTPITTENYTVVGIDLNGCLGSATATIVVNAIPNITANSSTICAGQQTATLTANGASTYSWIPSANLSAGNGSIVTGTPASTENFTIVGTDANGCISLTTATIAVNSLPAMTISPNLTICPLAVANLTAGGATTYTWLPSLNLSSANGSVVIASPSSTTTYTVIGSTSTCTNSAEVVVTITANPTLSIVSSPSIICSGNLSTLSASGANTYTWSPAATLNSSNGSNVNANPNITTVYSVSGTNAFGCLSSTTATLSVVTTPTITAIANPSSICPGQTSTLSVVGASNYTWSPSFSISNPNSSSTIASPALTTIYNVIGSIGNTSFLCTSSNTVQVTIIPAPTITVSPQIIICEGQSTTIYAVGANSYTWSPAIGLTNPNAASTNLNPTGSGTFIYTVTAANINCAATETVEVIVNPLPIINAGADTTINIDNSLVLFGTGNTNVGFLSTDGTQLSCNYCYSLTVNPQNNTCYTLEGINNFGCRTIDDICVTVTKDWDVFIPNAFTPNGDKNNELFIPVGYGITEMRLTIFDRWGNLIFKSNGETIGWDGKKNGQLCEQGVYIYQAEITSISGTNLKKTGHVTLLSRVK